MQPNQTPRTRPDHHARVSDPRASAIRAPNGARYKMLSPAKLPISRLPCLTVPPGVSPGALLDSPVLLNNAKAEASPTTGTFSFHSVVNNPIGSNSLSSPRGASKNSACIEWSSGDFEFKPHINTSSCSGVPSLGQLASVNTTQLSHESSRKIQSQPESHSLESSQLAQADKISRSSQELTVSPRASDPPIETSQSEVNVPDDITSDQLQQLKVSDSGMQALPCDDNGFSSSTVVEKSSEDGYNWRKYGQKHVKGCEFPRSYYKCAHANCQVKKLLERSYDGQITEIIYKGQHDHPKTSRRLAFGTILPGQGEERSDRLSSLASAAEKLSNEHHMDRNGSIELFPASPCDDDAEVGVRESIRNGDEVAAADDPESKRRKVDNATFDATQIGNGKTNREPRVVVQTISEVDILDDGYRWRKYGQKVVKGNPNPRSYYKCTNTGCSVRKHVERASHDPKAVITTYEGKHNHGVPAPRNSSHDTAMPMVTTQIPTALSSSMIRNSFDTITTSQPYTRPEETGMISLDLGVGISANTNGSSNGLCGLRGGNAEGFSFRTSAVNHPSEHYYSNSGNLIMGP